MVRNICFSIRYDKLVRAKEIGNRQCLEKGTVMEQNRSCEREVVLQTIPSARALSRSYPICFVPSNCGALTGSAANWQYFAVSFLRCQKLALGIRNARFVYIVSVNQRPSHILNIVSTVKTEFQRMQKQFMSIIVC